MTAARKIKNPAAPAPKPKLEVVADAPKAKTKNPRRRRHKRRKKNMSTGAKVAIGAAIVLVGIPLVLFTIGAIGVAVVAKKGIDDMNKNTPSIDGKPVWNYWGEMQPNEYWSSYIRSPSGEVTLIGTDYAAEGYTWTPARNAIEERGGTPIQGKPV